MSVARINQFQAQKGKGNSLKELLISFIPQIKKSEGCESCQVLISNSDPDRLVVLEVWDSIESHQAQVRSIPVEQITELMKIVAGPPKGGFYNFP